jgi:Txe/YoeB family toxin of Txe-Axe toxin-antitoxin module
VYFSIASLLRLCYVKNLLPEKEKRMIDPTHKEFHFFKPKELLTKAIAEQNQRLLSESLQRVSPEEELSREAFEGDEPEHEPLMESYFGKLSRRVRRNSEEQQVKQLQRLMGERLYHYLATLAESPYAREGGRFDIWEYIPSGMANLLGLAAAFDNPVPESERIVYTRHLLGKFTEEFRDWLVEEHKSYVCAWGEISLDEQDRLMLQAYSRNETQVEEASVQEAGVG